MTEYTSAMPDREYFLSKTAMIVTSYVAQHQVAAWMLPDVILEVFDTLKSLGQDGATAEISS
jgi:predicted transcriptional regulator